MENPMKILMFSVDSAARFLQGVRYLATNMAMWSTMGPCLDPSQLPAGNTFLLQYAKQFYRFIRFRRIFEMKKMCRIISSRLFRCSKSPLNCRSKQVPLEIAIPTRPYHPHMPSGSKWPIYIPSVGSCIRPPSQHIPETASNTGPSGIPKIWKIWKSSETCDIITSIYIMLVKQYCKKPNHP